MSQAKTMFQKIWEPHVVATRDGGEVLLYIDRHFLHEGSFHAFEQLKLSGRNVRRRDLTFAIADHYVPTVNREAGPADPEIRNMLDLFDENTERENVTAFGPAHGDQGIVHVVGPELGLTLPGMTIVCGDSHTSTHGALGALAFGIGASEVAHVLATQTLWQRQPKSMRITLTGQLGTGVSAKDVILAIIARIGADGAAGHVIEYAGQAIRGLSMEGRMTVCNMSIEAGGRAGMVAPDTVTLAYVDPSRRYAPKGDAWENAAESWLALSSDEDAVFDREVEIDAGEIAPTITWGTSPEEALPVTARVPDPNTAAGGDAVRRKAIETSLEYMGLKPGDPLDGIAVDKVFIGSCTNGRIEDLRAAAVIAEGRKAVVPTIVVPGSRAVARQAEAEGLDRVLSDAGFEWRDAGCSMCVGINGDQVAPGERCASTTNRNFKGRQGPGARTHLMGPAMAAAAAVTGKITDVRRLADT